jgi:HTH-type transcriptional regulator/antitoxin HigA
MGFKNKDLEPIIGSKGHVSTILSDNREIILKMAQKLKNYFGIPFEVFYIELSFLSSKQSMV